MFHRVDEPMDLPASRYFRMAQRLHLRGGALTAALVAEQRPQQHEGWSASASVRDDQVAARSAVAEGTAADVAAVAAMSQQPGFPSIGYAQ